jgi:DNA helicase HerA-like ATPase
MEDYPMRVVTKLSLAAALLGSLVAFSAGAQANDWDHRWDRDHDRYRHEYRDHYRHDRVIERRVVEQRPVIVERPMMYAPPVVYQQPQGPSGLNLNFNIPLN